MEEEEEDTQGQDPSPQASAAQAPGVPGSQGSRPQAVLMRTSPQSWLWGRRGGALSVKRLHGLPAQDRWPCVPAITPLQGRLFPLKRDLAGLPGILQN